MKWTRRKGSFATGYEKITRKAWICPEHGEVSAREVVLSRVGADANYVDFHVGCGHRVKRETVGNRHAGST